MPSKVYKKRDAVGIENKSYHKKCQQQKDESVKYHSARDSLSLPSKSKYRKCEKCKNHQSSLFDAFSSSKRTASLLGCISSGRSVSKKPQKSKKKNKGR